MAYYQGENGNCWTYAGAQCVTSYLLSTYGIIVDFSAVRTHGQGTIATNTGGTFQIFLDNISKVEFMSVDATAAYRVLDAVADQGRRETNCNLRMQRKNIFLAPKTTGMVTILTSLMNLPLQAIMHLLLLDITLISTD